MRGVIALAVAIVAALTFSLVGCAAIVLMRTWLMPNADDAGAIALLLGACVGMGAILIFLSIYERLRND